MRAYWFDNVEGDQRLPHDSGRSVDPSYLANLGVIYRHVTSDEEVNALAKERSYKNRDEITVSPEKMGDIYEDKVKSFFHEHLHEDEEIRYILDGAGFFDVRSEGDDWVRIWLEQGDLIVLPAGIYHRFTTDDKNYIKAMRLFKEEPKWTPLNRSVETDENHYRKEYLTQRHVTSTTSKTDFDPPTAPRHLVLLHARDQLTNHVRSTLEPRPLDPLDPFDPFDFNTFLSSRSQKRHSHAGRFPEPRSRSFPTPLSAPYIPYPRALNPSYHKPPKPLNLPKYSRFSDVESPPSTDFSTSEWDDTYALDTDSDIPRIPSFPRRRYLTRNSISRPDLDRVSLKLPSPMARELRLRSDEIVFLPPLVHLHIKLRFHGGKEELRAAVPGSMAFEDVTKQVVQAYLGEGLVYTARVEQRGRMCEVAKEACLQDLAHRGEVWRNGKREMKVEIVGGGDEVWFGGRGRFGQGPSGGGDAEVEMIRKREVSRTKYARKC
ncbi:1,2-dihydroxy-3-keto-5-methylthiopentene dioxygenase [Didymella sp. IMI 355093]|nr:1,2-dihydroxy-3-keto-5-methylthiopentene dioxygenase [Didymella sp. IMI 355093]